MWQTEGYTLREIRAYLRKIDEIQQLLNQTPDKDPEGKRRKLIMEIADELGAYVPLERNFSFTVDFLNAVLQNTRVALQIRMTVNACTSAKWSCVFAAVAAFLSLLTTALTLVLG